MVSDYRIKRVRSEIALALAKAVPERLADSPVLDDRQDLLQFLDSFSFVQLLMAIEEPLGIELDLTTVDLGEIVRFGDLVAFVLESSPASSAPTLAEAG